MTESYDEAREQDVVDFLMGLPHPHLSELLRRVFARKLPYPDETWHEHRYFLGIGGRTPVDDEDDPTFTKSKWGPWEERAVGYIDRDRYPDWDGEQEFAQHGRCPTCDIEVSASVKVAFCPICGTRVGLT